MTPKPISDATMQTQVSGLNIQPGTLAEQLTADQPTLLVFLRHYG